MQCLILKVEKMSEKEVNLLYKKCEYCKNCMQGARKCSQREENFVKNAGHKYPSKIENDELSSTDNPTEHNQVLCSALNGNSDCTENNSVAVMVSFISAPPCYHLVLNLTYEILCGGYLGYPIFPLDKEE